MTDTPPRGTPKHGVPDTAPDGNAPEGFYRLLVESVQDYAIFALDAKGRVLTWSAGAARLKGYARTEIVGRHFSAFYPPEDVAEGKPQRELELAARTGRIEDEGWRVRRDGTRFWASVVITALRDELGKLVGYAKVTRDLTERRRETEELRESEARFRLLVESVRDYAIFLLDAEGHVATWNAGAERIKGYRAEEIVGRHFSTFYPEDRVAERFPQHELEVATRVGRFEDEGWRIRKDGTRFWANVVITALRGASGELVGFAKVTRDLTERRAAEEQARRLAAEEAARAAAEGREEELRVLNEQLQNQAVELEQQTEEAQALAEELQEANESLAASESITREALARFEGVFNTRVVGLAVLDAATRRTVVVNDHLLDLIGYTRAEFERGIVDWRDVTPPEYHASEELALRQLLEGGKAEPFEKEYLRRDGTRVPVAVSGAAIPGLSGQYAVFVEDLTARRRAERALAERERQFRLMVDSIPQLAWMAQPDGYIDWYNRRWYEYTGTKAEQMAGWGWRSVHDPQVLPAVLERWSASIATGEPFEMTFPLRGADGRFRPFLTRVTPVRDADGRVARWFGTNTDVESERAAREAAERAERRVAFLASASAELAASLDARATLDAVARLAVPALADWCFVETLDDRGVPQPQVIRHTSPERVALGWEVYRRYPIRPENEFGSMRVARTGEPVLLPEVPEEALASIAHDAEHLHLLRDVAAFRSLVQVPLRVRERVAGVLTFATSAESGRTYGPADLDMALEVAARASAALERAHLYEAERAARADAEAAAARAEEASRAKSDFLATMSHELRTPLNAIAGYAQLLEMELHGPVTREQREDLDRIRRSQEHLTRLINEVLSYARLEGGAITYDIRPTRVADAVEAAAAQVEPQRAAKRIALDVRLPEDAGLPPQRVLADGDKLQQVLINLLANAVKFTPDGGRVTIESPAEPDERGLAVLRVSDTGIGIPAGKLEAIFEPFVQVGRSLSSPGEGTGLGLAISRDLARGMGGDLTVTSEPVGGSTFTLTLPWAGGE